MIPVRSTVQPVKSAGVKIALPGAFALFCAHALILSARAKPRLGLGGHLDVRARGECGYTGQGRDVATGLVVDAIECQQLIEGDRRLPRYATAAATPADPPLKLLGERRRGRRWWWCSSATRRLDPTGGDATTSGPNAGSPSKESAGTNASPIRGNVADGPSKTPMSYRVAFTHTWVPICASGTVVGNGGGGWQDTGRRPGGAMQRAADVRGDGKNPRQRVPELNPSRGPCHPRGCRCGASRR